MAIFNEFVQNYVKTEGFTAPKGAVEEKMLKIIRIFFGVAQFWPKKVPFFSKGGPFQKTFLAKTQPHF